MVSQKVVIKNPTGLHLRPAVQGGNAVQVSDHFQIP